MAKTKTRSTVAFLAKNARSQAANTSGEDKKQLQRKTRSQAIKHGALGEGATAFNSFKEQPYLVPLNDSAGISRRKTRSQAIEPLEMKENESESNQINAKSKGNIVKKAVVDGATAINSSKKQPNLAALNNSTGISGRKTRSQAIEPLGKEAISLAPNGISSGNLTDNPNYRKRGPSPRDPQLKKENPGPSSRDPRLKKENPGPSSRDPRLRKNNLVPASFYNNGSNAIPEGATAVNSTKEQPCSQTIENSKQPKLSNDKSSGNMTDPIVWKTGASSRDPRLKKENLLSSKFSNMEKAFDEQVTLSERRAVDPSQANLFVSHSDGALREKIQDEAMVSKVKELIKEENATPLNYFNDTPKANIEDKCFAKKIAYKVQPIDGNPSVKEANPSNINDEALAYKPPVENTILLVKNLPPNMKEQEFSDLFAQYGAIRSIQLVRDSTGNGMSYGFVEFEVGYHANAAEICLNGHQVVGKSIRVSFLYPFSNNIKNKHDPPGENTNVLVNYLPPDMRRRELKELFEKFGYLKSVKIITDLPTGKSMLYGFVDFEVASNAYAAEISLDGLNVRNKTIRVSSACKFPNDIKKNMLYVGNLPIHYGKKELLSMFRRFGKVWEVKMLRDQTTGVNRGVAFVHYDYKESVQIAIRRMHGHMLPNNPKPLVVKLAEPPKSLMHPKRRHDETIPGGPSSAPDMEDLEVNSRFDSEHSMSFKQAQQQCEPPVQNSISKAITHSNGMLLSHARNAMQPSSSHRVMPRSMAEKQVLEAHNTYIGEPAEKLRRYFVEPPKSLMHPKRRHDETIPAGPSGASDMQDLKEYSRFVSEHSMRFSQAQQQCEPPVQNSISKAITHSNGMLLNHARNPMLPSSSHRVMHRPMVLEDHNTDIAEPSKSVMHPKQRHDETIPAGPSGASDMQDLKEYSRFVSEHSMRFSQAQQQCEPPVQNSISKAITHSNGMLLNHARNPMQPSSSHRVTRRPMVDKQVLEAHNTDIAESAEKLHRYFVEPTKSMMHPKRRHDETIPAGPSGAPYMQNLKDNSRSVYERSMGFKQAQQQCEPPVQNSISKAITHSNGMLLNHARDPMQPSSSHRVVRRPMVLEAHNTDIAEPLKSVMHPKRRHDETIPAGPSGATDMQDLKENSRSVYERSMGFKQAQPAKKQSKYFNQNSE